MSEQFYFENDAWFTSQKKQDQQYIKNTFELKSDLLVPSGVDDSAIDLNTPFIVTGKEYKYDVYLKDEEGKLYLINFGQH